MSTIYKNTDFISYFPQLELQVSDNLILNFRKKNLNKEVLHCVNTGVIKQIYIEKSDYFNQWMVIDKGHKGTRDIKGHPRDKGQRDIPGTRDKGQIWDIPPMG
jgi:hypothetical protein